MKFLHARLGGLNPLKSAMSAILAILAFSDDFKPSVRVVSVPLVAHGHLSARGHPVGCPGWCGTAVGGAGWLAAGGRRDTIISGNSERVRIR